MLLSGPPSALIFFKPDVQVNNVINATPPELDKRHAKLSKKRDADTKIRRRLLFGEATHTRERQIACLIIRPGIFGSNRLHISPPRPML